jgi:hypothetical protein
MLAQIKSTLSLKLNGPGFSRHNAFVQIMILQDWGLGRQWMSSAVSDVAKKEPLNPFFQYVAHRRTSKASMLPLIDKECPSNEKEDNPHRRWQWSWERDTKGKEWVNTMYWDCLFIAAMYAEKQGPPPDGDSGKKWLRAQLDKLIGEASKRQADAQAALKKITDWKENPLEAATQPVSDFEKAVQNPGEFLEDKAKELPGRAGRRRAGRAPTKILALSGHTSRHAACLLSGVKRTLG